MNLLAIATGDWQTHWFIANVLINEYDYKPYLIRALSDEAVMLALSQVRGIDADFYRKNANDVIPGNNRGHTYKELVESNHLWIMDHFGRTAPVEFTVNRIKKSKNKGVILDLTQNNHAIYIRKQGGIILHPKESIVTMHKEDLPLLNTAPQISKQLAEFLKQQAAS